MGGMCELDYDTVNGLTITCWYYTGYTCIC